MSQQSAHVGLLHFELAVRDLPFIVVKCNALLIEEGSDLFPDVVDAVGWVATEKPSLLENFRGADLLGSEVEPLVTRKLKKLFLTRELTRLCLAFSCAIRIVVRILMWKVIWFVAELKVGSVM